MKKIFRDFTRHYHKVRKLVPEIAEQGGFTFKIDMREQKLSASVSTPNQETSIQFAVLMRRFLARQSDLYYEKILEVLQEHAPHILTEEKQQRIKSYIDSLKQGSFSMEIDGRHLTSEEIYDLVSEGQFFHNDEEISSYLRSLSSFPVTGPLFLHQFYSYALDGFRLISHLFDLISQWQSEDLGEEAEAISHPKCIYCLGSDNTFQSEEHIFPEGLGNDEAVLPKGYVCDNCNNGILSNLDSYLLKFEPIALLQVQYVPYTKSGKLPKANFQNMTVEKTHPSHIRITAKDKTGGMQNRKELGNGWISWNMNFRGKQVDTIRLGRSLYKIGLGFVALDQGLDTVLSARFDAARDYIIGKTGFPNNLLMRMNVKPHPSLRVHYRNLNPGCPLVVDIFGMILMFNLEAEPLMEPNDDLIKLGFQKFWLEKPKNAS
jgi:hypothetical protein